MFVVLTAVVEVLLDEIHDLTVRLEPSCVVVVATKAATNAPDLLTGAV